MNFCLHDKAGIWKHFSYNFNKQKLSEETPRSTISRLEGEIEDNSVKWSKTEKY